MKFGAILAAVLCLLTAASLVMPDYADAARFGGGGSFGGRPAFRQPAPRPAPAQQRQPGAQNAAPQGQRPSMFGGIGGFLGGLLAGSLLASFFSGHGFAGGGLLDIIILGFLAFLAYGLFKYFRNRQVAPASADSSGNDFNPGSPLQRQDAASSAWDSLRGQAAPQESVLPGVAVPPGFDVDDFMAGAKLAYTHLQKAWDRRDLADIGQFATPAVIATLEEQLRSDPNPGHTEIMLINSQFLGAENEGDDQRAQVYFDVLMREDPSQQTPNSAREIWHFLRKGKNGTWKLDGIQQVE